MFFRRKKKNAGTVFKKYYLRIVDITQKSSLARNSEFEIIPAMMIICDYAAASARMDRQQVQKDILEDGIEITRQYCYAFDPVIYDERINFYGEIIRGRELRAEWSFQDIDYNQLNAISRVSVALCDILLNPLCAKDYDNAPIQITDIFAITEFTTNVFTPILEELTNLFKETYDLAKAG